MRKAKQPVWVPFLSQAHAQKIEHTYCKCRRRGSRKDHTPVDDSPELPQSLRCWTHEGSFRTRVFELMSVW